MNERFIMRMCLIGSIIGITGILVIVSQMTYETVNIGDISDETIGETINVSGIVTDKYVHENGHIFFSISDEIGSIKTVVWSDLASSLPDETIKEKNKINVVGNVNLYEGEHELIAKEVRLL